MDYGFIINQVGHEQCPKNHGYGPAIRDHYLVHFVKAGQGIYRYKNDEVAVKQNEYFMIPPGEVTYYEADSEFPWEYYWIGLSGRTAEELMHRIGLTQEVRKQAYNLSHFYNIYDVIMELESIKLERDSDHIYEVAKVYEIISWLCRSLEDSHVTTKPIEKRHLKIAQDYIRRHFMWPVTIEQIANHVGIDRTLLFRYFKEETGKGPKQYLTKLRMQYAVELRKSKELSIKEICFSVGYTDPYLFSKTFKKHFGVSPKRYRAMDKQK